MAGDEWGGREEEEGRRTRTWEVEGEDDEKGRMMGGG